MGNIRIKFDVSLHGAIADDMVEPILDRYAHHLEGVLADKGVAMIRAYLPTQYMYLGANGGDPFRNRVPPGAGHLVTTIHDISVADYALIVQDEGVYGPWIEGEAIGNNFFWPGRVRRGLSPRFSGYHTFRKIADALDDMAEEVAEEEIQYYIREINNY
jgi:hypothetical protein